MKPSAVGSHIFAGSFTVGVEKHFDVVAHLESSKYGVRTFEANRPHIPVYTDPETWPLDELAEMGIDFVYGNPPCAPWARQGLNGSVQNERDWRDDERLGCIEHHVEILNRVRPKFWVWESVTRAFTVGRELVDMIQAMAIKAGYSVTHFLHEANFLGSPQKRPRYMMIVHDRPITWAAPSWKRTKLSDVWHRVEDVRHEGLEIRPTSPEIWERWQKLMPYLGPNEKLRPLWIEAYPDVQRGRPYNMVRRLDLDQPTTTLVGGAAWVHPTEDRFLDTNELAVLMGYPDGWDFTNTRPGPITYEISRGVCVEVAEYVAGCVAASLDNKPCKPRVSVVDFMRAPGRVQRLELA